MPLRSEMSEEERERLRARDREYNKRYAERRRAWKRSNAEHVLEVNRKWQENNREKCRAYVRKWASKNMEHVAEYGARYREENREYLNSYARDKYHSDPEGSRAAVRSRYRSVKEKNPKAHEEHGRRFYHRNPSAALLHQAKQRAKEKGLEFNIDVSDVVIPEFCPLLGIRIILARDARPGKKMPYSPSIDRIDSKRGYVKGNVWVISSRANTIKNDATYQEILQIGYNLKAKVTGKL